ncbi:MAG: SdiA-regulated domain-containing protein [Saprospiraceae bacterium]|nr:SdiA-regulated domain-containing protein [Saprospiraceae bacterium]MCB9321846.1 SdiA-regulated domain-containing protein [Lewinellaceae bacterium]
MVGSWNKLMVLWGLILSIWQLHCQLTTPVIGAPLPYETGEPDATYQLPGILREISGLAWYDDTLWAIQDEDGLLFKMVPQDQEINITNFQFGPKDDYEALEWMDGYCYVVTSEAKLWQIDPKNKTSRRLPSFWGKKHNVEGLTVTEDGHGLWVAAKEDQHDEERAVIAIDPNNLDASSKSRFSISDDKIRSFIKAQNNTGLKVPDKIDFHSSSIALNPLTGELFVLSSPEPQLLVLDPKGKIKSWQRLSSLLYPQPESMCFAPDGTLYIANEGKHGAATLLVFHPKKS